jgi:Ca2+/H+ antiporter
MGNIVGSSISNILGAFSLGLIFSSTNTTFDKSAKIYTGVLLGVTTLFTLFILFFQNLGRFGGVVLILTFIIYIISIAWAIYKGIVEPPVDSDSDSDSDSESSDSSDDDDESFAPLKKTGNRSISPQSSTTTLHGNDNEHDIETAPKSSRKSRSRSASPTPLPQQDPEACPLAEEMFDEVNLGDPVQVQKAGKHSTPYHLANLTFGFLALSLSGYILSHSISTISASFNLSSSLLGVTLLSFATTLPEKLVSIVSSRRGESGIVIANTAGSNIFLVTLCAGVLFCSGDLASLKLEGVTTFEVGAMWLSSVVLFGIVMFGGRRWMGWALFGAYVAFIGGEFVLDRRS